MVKVADFGTSRFLEIAAHGTTVIGSPPYMAPEQFQGKAVFASDIYSLGVTMYQMLTGTLPYDTPSPGGYRAADAGRAGHRRRGSQNSRDPQGDQRHRDEGDGAGRSPTGTSAPPICWTTSGGARTAGRTGGPIADAWRRPGLAPTCRDEAQRHPGAAQSARNAAGEVLLALPEAAACPHRQLPVLRGDAVARTDVR